MNKTTVKDNFPLPKEYSACSLDELLVALLSALFPKIPNKHLIVDILTRMPIFGIEKSPWSVAKVEKILANLKGNKCLGSDYKPSTKQGHELLCYFSSLDVGREVIKLFPPYLRTCRQNISSQDIEITQCRSYFYLNDVKAVPLYIRLIDKEKILPYYAEHQPDSFFLKLKANLQVVITENLISFALKAKLNEFNPYLSDFVNICITKPIISNAILSYFLFIVYDLNSFNTYLNKAEEIYPYNELFEITNEFLHAQGQEDCVLIAKKYKEHIRKFRKFSGDKGYALDFPFDIMYLLCLAKAFHALDTKDEIKKDYTVFIKSAYALSSEHPIFEHLFSNNLSEKMLCLLTQKALDSTRTSNFQMLVYFIALASLPRDAERDTWIIANLKVYYLATKDKAPFLATIFAQILSSILEPEKSEEYTQYANRLSFFNFSLINKAETSLEKRIDAIYSFITNADPRQSGKKKINKNPKRLAWLVSFAYQEVNPYEQSFSKDEWTKGRKVSVVKLKDNTEEYSYLSEQDKEIIKKSAKKDYWADNYTIDYNIAMPLLASHPLVFDEQSAKNIQLELKPLKLDIEKIKASKDEEYQLSFALPSHKVGIYTKQEGNTYSVTPITQQHIHLKELMGTEKLIVPKTVQEKVLELVSHEESPVEVRLNMELKELSAHQINSTPTFRLKRTHSNIGLGLEVSAIVYPLENTQTFFTPTKGSASLVVQAQTSPIKINRNFEQEQNEINALLELCPTLKTNLLNDEYTWELLEPETAYQALLELQEGKNTNASLNFEWFNSQPIKISHTLNANEMKVRVQSKNNWFSLEGNIQVDENLVLDMRKLLKESKKNRGKFIPLHDGQILSITEDFKRLLDKLNAISQEDKSEQILHPLAIPALENIMHSIGLEEEVLNKNFTFDKNFRTWQTKLQELDKAISLPKNLQAELRPYQYDGFNWLASLVHIGAGACLADDMGLGKTLQSITLILHTVQNTEIDYSQLQKNSAVENNALPVLIVAPTSVCHNWESELTRFAPTLSVKRLTAMNSKKERKAVIKNLAENEILILGYSLLNSEITTLLERNFKLIIFDEAQALKNAQTIRSKSSAMLNAHSKIALTGTPIENSLEDLWSIFNIINHGLLGTNEAFNYRFNPPATALDVTKNNARNNLKALVKPFILRRTKNTVLDDLPPRTEQNLIIEPSAEERAFYEALRRQALENIEKIKNSNQEKDKQSQFHILAELTKLRQACCNPSLVDPSSTITSSKLSMLLELINELRSNNHQALIFSQFTGNLKLVYSAISELGIKTMYLDGSTQEKKRAELVSSFQNGQADVFCISLKAGGQGLNLTAADYVIHLDPWWNPAVEDQASDRAYRIGQTRPVTVYKLIMQGTVEEKILKMHDSKRNLAEDVLAGTSNAQRLSVDDLMTLFS